MNSFINTVKDKNCKFIFKNLIETERLILRSVTVDDALIINKAVLESYDSLKEWVFWAESSCVMNNCITWCNDSYSKFLRGKELIMLTFEKGSNNLVGVVSLFNIKEDLKICDIGYWGVTQYSGKGYITESVKCLKSYTMNELSMNRIWLTCDERNKKSIRVAELAQFTYEGTLHKDQKDKSGNLRNTSIYASWKE